MERLARRTHSEHGEPSKQMREPPLPREHHQWTPLARALTAMGDRWTLLIVAELASGPKRLFELRTSLPGISAGVLDRHLQQMVEFGLISRKRFRELPPRVEFRLTRTGSELAPIAVRLACWGIRHVWTEPHLHEQVDVNAILHMLPAMLAGERLPDGTIELAVDDRGRRERHTFRVRGGHLTPSDPGDGGSVTRMVGETYDWVDALGPDRRYAALRVTGDQRLAKRLLKALLG
jgi:DNA-binding HxlR family transcriptional regulator